MMGRAEIQEMRDELAPLVEYWRDKLRGKQGNLTGFEAGLLAQAMQTNLLLCEILLRMEYK